MALVFIGKKRLAIPIIFISGKTLDDKRKEAHRLIDECVDERSKGKEKGKTMRKINAIEIGPEDYVVGMDGKSTMKQSAVEAIRLAELVVSIKGEVIKSRSIPELYKKKESVEDKAAKMANVRKALGRG